MSTENTEKKPAAEKKPKTEKTQQAEKAVKAEKKVKEEKPVEKVKKVPAEKYIPRLRKLYETDVVAGLKNLYKYETPMAIPKMVKVIVNIGLGEATQDKGVLDPSVDEITLIAGQKAVKTIAKKSISNFHLREGMPIGVRVTLRSTRMYDFMDKLISVALPRVRDFKGLNPGSFDGRGNYTIGLKEQLVFPEIDYDKIKKIRGMDITLVTTAKTDDEAYQLFKLMGFPFKEK
jgi:large subunit ribosomal protein L5